MLSVTELLALYTLRIQVATDYLGIEVPKRASCKSGQYVLTFTLAMCSE